MPNQDSDRNPIDVLADEFLERIRRGEHPPLSEYTERRPDLADEIRELFPILVEMEEVCPHSESTEDDGGNGALPSVKELGDYRIIREVGRGGMGIVYEAEQISLGRRVALKVLPQQMLLNPTHQRRFDREARAAGKLHHTNIVPVFGVGQADGYYFYVMQFIAGMGLDEVISEVRRMNGTGSSGGSTPAEGSLRVVHRDDVSAVDVAQSLMTGQFQQNLVSDDSESEDATDVGDLTQSQSNSSSDTFTVAASSSIPGGVSGHSSGGQQAYWHSVARIGRQVADALDYAHRQGILHRDIKPGNLLLDLRGTVWITDFGLAKASDQHDLTHTGDILGTLRYIPPEAFEGTADARGDVYSLGLTLYELLAMRPAFGETDKHKLIRQVTTTEPQRLDKLNPRIPRDLVTIVHKAIDRDPAHRYQTAEGLADDLERFLHDEPIRARRTSSIERLTRWARRNYGLATSLGSIAVLLVIGLAISMVAAHFREMAGTATTLAMERAAEAEEQRDAAETQRNLARRAVDKMFTQVAEQWLSQNASLEPVQEEFLQEALDFYTELAKEQSDDPEVLLETGNAYRRIADIQFKLGKRAEAEAAYGEAGRICSNLVDRYPDVPRYREALGKNLHHYAYMLQYSDQHERALETYRQAYREREALAESQPENAEHRRDALLSQGGMANLLNELGQRADSIETYRQALETADSLPAEIAQEPSFQFRLGLLNSEMAMVLRNEQRHEEEFLYFDKGQSIYKQLVERFPRNAAYRNELAFSYFEESWSRRRNDPEKREQAARNAVTIEGRLVEESPGVPDYQLVLAMSCRELGNAVKERGERAEGEALLRRSVELMRRLILENPDLRPGFYRATFQDAISSLISLGEEYVTLQERRELLEELVETYTRAFDRHPEFFEEPNWALRIANSQRDLALARFAVGDMAGGRSMLRRALSFVDARLSERPDERLYSEWRSQVEEQCATYLTEPGVSSNGAAAEHGRPNIVIILVDDLGYGDLGCYGSSLNETPNIDRLAERGLRCTDFHSNGPMCSATRAALLTGCYQQRFGPEFDGALSPRSNRGLGLPLEAVTMAEMLRDAGYATGMFGKWHLGYKPPLLPVSQGFDEFRGLASGDGDHHTHIDRSGLQDWWHNDDIQMEQGYTADLLTNYSIDFIERHASRPFFLYLAHLAIHFPWQGPDDPPHRVEGTNYADDKWGVIPDRTNVAPHVKAMIASVDESVGRVMAALQRLGLEQNTLVVFASDNGGYLNYASGGFENISSNGPLKGQKGSVHEGGHRVPSIFCWPGHIEAGRETDETLMSMDLFPTIAALASATLPAKQKVDGIDLAPLLFDQQRLGERILFWRSGEERAVREGAWKLNLSDSQQPQLFNLETDLGETVNRADEHHELVSRLKSAYATWEADVNSGFMTSIDR